MSLFVYVVENGGIYDIYRYDGAEFDIVHHGKRGYLHEAEQRARELIPLYSSIGRYEYLGVLSKEQAKSIIATDRAFDEPLHLHHPK